MIFLTRPLNVLSESTVSSGAEDGGRAGNCCLVSSDSGMIGAILGAAQAVAAALPSSGAVPARGNGRGGIVGLLLLLLLEYRLLGKDADLIRAVNDRRSAGPLFLLLLVETGRSTMVLEPLWLLS